MSEYKPEDLERAEEHLKKYGCPSNAEMRNAWAAMLLEGAQAMRELEAAQERMNVLERVISALKKPTPEVFAEIENYYGVLMRGDLHPAEFLKEIVRAALQVKP